MHWSPRSSIANVRIRNQYLRPTSVRPDKDIVILSIHFQWVPLGWTWLLDQYTIRIVVIKENFRTIQDRCKNSIDAWGKAAPLTHTHTHILWDNGIPDSHNEWVNDKTTTFPVLAIRRHRVDDREFDEKSVQAKRIPSWGLCTHYTLPWIYIDLHIYH